MFFYPVPGTPAPRLSYFGLIPKNGVANVSDPIFAKRNSDHKTIIVLCASIVENNAFHGLCGMNVRVCLLNRGFGPIANSCLPYSPGKKKSRQPGLVWRPWWVLCTCHTDATALSLLWEAWRPLSR